LKVAAEDASGVGEGKEFPKGTADTKKEDLWYTEWVWGTHEGKLWRCRNDG